MQSDVEITDEVRTYQRSDVITVHRTRERFGGLSNMAAHFPVRVNGIRILTIEALYQACRFPHLPEVQREIIAQHSPMTAKMKSKPHRENSRKDWLEVRHRVMRWSLRVKLAYHYESFGRLLLSTENQDIVELSSKDDYWGAKLTEEDENLMVGQNVLGRLLMELREQYRGDSGKQLLFVPRLNIQNFSLLGVPIEPICAKNADLDSETGQRVML